MQHKGPRGQEMHIFITSCRAISVVWAGQKPDWNASKRLFQDPEAFSWWKTAFCRTFDKKRSLEIGQ